MLRHGQDARIPCLASAAARGGDRQAREVAEGRAIEAFHDVFEVRVLPEAGKVDLRARRIAS